jgi:uncharacterized membrane protein
MAGGVKKLTKRISSRLVSYFLQGLFLFSPIALTAYSIIWVFNKVDGLLVISIPGVGIIPGSGILILVGIILLVGFLGSTIIFEAFWKIIDNFFSKFPLTKFIYPPLKDIFGAVMGKERKLNKPVLFRISKDSDLERIGFITESDLSNLGIGPEKVAVYAPHSYNFSGNVYIVPVENIKPLDTDASEAMKFVVAGGMVKIKETDREKANEPIHTVQSGEHTITEKEK